MGSGRITLTDGGVLAGRALAVREAAFWINRRTLIGFMTLLAWCFCGTCSRM